MKLLAKATSGVAVTLLGLGLTIAQADSKSDGYLVKIRPENRTQVLGTIQATGLTLKPVALDWYRVSAKNKRTRISMGMLRALPGVAAAQPNYKIRLMHDYKVTDAAKRAQLTKIKSLFEEQPGTSAVPADNPEIPLSHADGPGVDGKYSSQWGMQDNEVKTVWDLRTIKPTIVGVIDTGVDYTHEDLGGVLWRNPGEMGRNSRGEDKATNGKDDDGNGYVDDIVGWDFASNDNKPYDLTVEPLQLLAGGGNPGHGTHCAGNVGAKAENGKGIVGVAKEVKIMALRFLTEAGSGTVESAIQAIKYGVDNGARVLSNSWGSEGEEPGDPLNQALRDAIKYAEDHGVLFIAAAGNGHQGVGYDNDTDTKPGVPASYDNPNIISVAAIDVNNNLGSFSCWGLRSVDIGAPGVKVFSTVPANKYQDTIELIWNGIDIGKLIGIEPQWDGTSMATPHVAGAAAAYWGMHPEKTWQQVKEAVLATAIPVPQLAGRVVTGGKLNMKALVTDPRFNH